MEILRVVARWTGFSGAPGYSSFHFAADAGFWDGGIIGDDAEVAANRVAQAVVRGFGSAASYLPTQVNVNIEPQVELINSDSGEILGAIDLGSFDTVSGRSEGGYSSASGAVVNWRTNDYRAGRRIRGRTFLVPISAAAYQDDGTLISDALDDFRLFAERIVDEAGASELGVWSRPQNGAGGVFATVTNGTVPDKVAVLRSRRD